MNEIMALMRNGIQGPIVYIQDIVSETTMSFYSSYGKISIIYHEQLDLSTRAAHYNAVQCNTALHVSNIIWN